MENSTSGIGNVILGIVAIVAIVTLVFYAVRAISQQEASSQEQPGIDVNVPLDNGDTGSNTGY